MMSGTISAIHTNQFNASTKQEALALNESLKKGDFGQIESILERVSNNPTFKQILNFAKSSPEYLEQFIENTLRPVVKIAVGVFLVDYAIGLITLAGSTLLATVGIKLLALAALVAGMCMILNVIDDQIVSRIKQEVDKKISEFTDSVTNF